MSVGQRIVGLSTSLTVTVKVHVSPDSVEAVTNDVPIKKTKLFVSGSGITVVLTDPHSLPVASGSGKSADAKTFLPVPGSLSKEREGGQLIVHCEALSALTGTPTLIELFLLFRSEVGEDRLAVLTVSVPEFTS